MISVRERLKEFEDNVGLLQLDPVILNLVRYAFYAGAHSVTERLYKTGKSKVSNEVGSAIFGGLVKGVDEEYEKAKVTFRNTN